MAQKKIRYNNFTNLDFPQFTLLTDLAFDGDSGEVSSYLNRDAISSESYDGKYNHTNFYKYNEMLAPTITFIKDDFSDFEPEQVRAVLSWLTSKSTPSFADFYDDIDSNAIIYSLLGGWTDIQLYKMGNGRVVGITAQFTSTNPWALSPLHIVTKTITQPTTFVINCDTDSRESLLYPKVIITQRNSIIVNSDHAMTNVVEHVPGTVYYYDNTYYWIDDGSVRQSQISAPSNWNTTGVMIENLTTNTQTQIGGSLINEVITLDGANRIVDSSYGNRIFGNNFNWIWIPLIYGNNTIKVTGNCVIEFSWRDAIKIGEL